MSSDGAITEEREESKTTEDPWSLVFAPISKRAEAAPVVEASDSGVEITDGKLTLELRTPASRASFVTVTTRGAAATRYTDAETGQITINHVYLDD